MGEQALGSARVREGFCIESLSQRASSRAPLIEKLVVPTFQAYRIAPSCGSRDIAGAIPVRALLKPRIMNSCRRTAFGFQRFSDASGEDGYSLIFALQQQALGVAASSGARKSC